MSRNMSYSLRILLNLRRLRHIRRCNNFPTICDEDVAQHSLYVTMLAVCLADDYNQHVTDGNTVDIDLVARKALCHDLEESFTSDIPWNVKHGTTEVNEAISRFTKSLMTSITERSDGMVRRMLNCNSTAKEGLEGAFVDIADSLELCIYAWGEACMGNTAMSNMMSKALNIAVSKARQEGILSYCPMIEDITDLVRDSSVDLDDIIILG